MYRNPEKKYHIDYCYCYPQYIKNVQALSKGKYLQFSDHVPLIFETQKEEA